jgi:hypothetical protein
MARNTGIMAADTDIIAPATNLTALDTEIILAAKPRNIAAPDGNLR